MKSPLAVLACFTTLSLLASAQNVPVAASAAPLSSARYDSNVLLQPMEVRHAAPSVTEPFLKSDGPSVLASWYGPKWDVQIENSVPRGTSGTKNLSVTGPLADALLGIRHSETETSLGQRWLELPIINALVPERLPTPAPQAGYLKWGERVAPWSVVSERGRPVPEGSLLSVRF